MKEPDVKKIVLRYSIITSVICLIIADLYVAYSDKFINYFLLPILSVDLNNDGEPDLTQMKKYNLKLFNKFNFPIGLIVFHIIILLMKIFLLAWLLKFILKYVKS